jgi:hypothetical protein
MHCKTVTIEANNERNLYTRVLKVERDFSLFLLCCNFIIYLFISVPVFVLKAYTFSHSISLFCEGFF